MSKGRRKRYILAIAALVAGGLIYLCCRSETLLMFAWCKRLGLGQVLGAARESVSGVIVFCPDWILLSLPNALWLFAGLVMLDAIWGAEFRKDKMFWLISFWGIAMGSEFAQAPHFLPGTFDWQDVSLMTLATLFSIAFIYHADKTERRADICV